MSARLKPRSTIEQGGGIVMRPIARAIRLALAQERLKYAQEENERAQAALQQGIQQLKQERHPSMPIGVSVG